MSDPVQSGDAPLPPPPTSYTCPGELYSISRGIHLARLAAFYHKCRDCEYRDDASRLASVVDGQRRDAVHRAVRTTLVTDESVRGVYLNDLDRTRSIGWGEAFAATLWETQPMIGRRIKADNSQIIAVPENTASGLKGPTVVVGFDERPSSPDIVSGVVLGLRRMGCPVIDLGQTTLSAVAFHVHSLEAAGGLFVTGAGCDSSFTGIEFLRRGGQLYPPESLRQLEQSVKTGVSRQSRQIGGHHPRQGQSDYEASLENSFHALRPLRIVCGTSTRLVRRTLDRLFAKLPCTLTHVALPIRHRNLFDGRDADLHRVAAIVVEEQHHLGLIIDEDGRHLAFITDRGRLVSPREIARLVIEVAQRSHHGANFVVSTSLFRDVNRWLIGRDAKAIDGGEVVADLVRILVEQEAALALSADGRVWFGSDYPVCDAILILAHVLQALSLSDASFSEVVTRISSDHNEQRVPD